MTHDPHNPLAAIVYSHSDADHATGAPVLQREFGGEVPIIAQENAFPIITERGDPDLPPPDSTFAHLGHLDARACNSYSASLRII